MAIVTKQWCSWTDGQVTGKITYSYDDSTNLMMSVDWVNPTSRTEQVTLILDADPSHPLSATIAPGNNGTFNLTPFSIMTKTEQGKTGPIRVPPATLQCAD